MTGQSHNPEMLNGSESVVETAHDRQAAPSRIEGLDGLRAIAVLAVLLYHMRPAAMPGGFLGVDVFFVISGFLITTLLLRELHAQHRLDVARFWLHRARRLLPALVLVVLVSISLGFIVGGDLLVNIRRQTLGALTFSNNWLEIGAGSNYFAHTSPLLFMNFWSLAVEEQFYLCWPVLLAFIMAYTKSLRGRVLTALGIAAASALGMMVLFELGEPSSRVYYGTDTHLFGLMIGAALAFAAASAARPLDTPWWQRMRAPAAHTALLLLLVSMLTMAQSSALTFRGGIVVASLLTAVVIAALLGPDGALRRGLQWPPLVWVGQRSYGIYLWHWPMILIVTAALPASTADSALNWFTSALALGLTLVLSWASFRWLEVPVRRLGFRVAAQRFSRWAAQPWTATRLPRITAASLVALILLSAVAIVSAPDKSAVQRQIEAAQAVVDESVVTAGHPAKPPGADFAMPNGEDITAFGDSLVVTSAHGLKDRFPGIMIDAQSNRQWPAARGAVTTQLAAGTVRRAVILHFGTNAGVHDQQLVHEVIDALGPRRMIVLVNLYGSWEESNPALASVAATHPNVIIADWYAAISAHPELLQSDGVHPGTQGGYLYADVVKDAFRRLSAR